MPDPSPPPDTFQNPQLVERFLERMRGVVPLTIEQIDAIVHLIAATSEPHRTFLDLACGDGTVSAAILNEFSTIHGVLVEESADLLEVARRRFRREAARTTFVTADFLKPSWIEVLSPTRQFDAVVSSFGLQRALADERQRLFGEIHSLLRPGGIFLIIEHVASTTRWSESPTDDYLIEAIFGDVLQAAPGQSRAEVARKYYERTREASSTLAPLEVQFDWLRAAGFEDVECFLKMQEMAVFGGIRTTH